jgi:hypothetical protein
MWRSQQRLQFANNIWAELQQQAAVGTLDFHKVQSAKQKLHKLWLAQWGERTPEAMTEHWEQYATLIEFLYRKVKDIRATGGQFFSQIEAEFDVFEAPAMQRARQQKQDLLRD